MINPDRVFDCRPGDRQRFIEGVQPGGHVRAHGDVQWQLAGIRDILPQLHEHPPAS